MAEKKLRDEEILKMIEEFYKLSDEDKMKTYVGRGESKKIFGLPNSNYLLKEIIDPNPESATAEAVMDYITHKQLSKLVPVETPILVTRGEQPPVLLQKELFTNNRFGSITEGVADIKNKLKSLGVSSNSADVHSGNVGLDSLGNAKVFDTGLFKYNDDIIKNKSLEKTRDTIFDKLVNKKTNKIYRSIPLIGPAIGAGLAAMSGDSNAASGLPVLGEADSLGPEQGSEDYEIENPQRNPAARRAALESLLKK